MFVPNKDAPAYIRIAEALESMAWGIDEIIRKLGGDSEDALCVNLFTDNPIEVINKEEK